MTAWFRSRAVSPAIVLGTTALLPVAVWWPGTSLPFQTPRLLLLGIALALHAVAALLRRDPWPPIPPVLRRITALWLLVIGVSATFAPHVSAYTVIVWALPIAWGVALLQARPSAAALTTALLAGSTAVSACALLQWAGWDPLAPSGWQPVGSYGPRMRVYATLGNPNFAGAYLAGMLPLSMAWSIEGSRLNPSRAGVPALHALAIAATGSRAAWLGTLAGAGILAIVRRDTRARWTAAALAAIITAGALLGPGRAIAATVQGRLHIWSSAAPHALDHPVIGWGPGSFAMRYPAWEAARITGGLDAASRQYVAAQRHAHNDYLEFLVELGVPGLVVFALLTAAAIAYGVRNVQRDGLRVAAAAGLAALGVIALVDFPFQRPVESITWWTLLALVLLTDRPRMMAANPAEAGSHG